MSFKGIIFDFNGVLWEDSHLHEAAWQQFARTIRSTPLSSNEFDEYVHGRTVRDTFEYLLKRSITRDELSQLTERKESIYRYLCLAEGDAFSLLEGTIALLDHLVVKNVPHTIATASEITNLRFFIQHLNLKKWFDVEKIIFDDGLIKGKPKPDFYIKAAGRLSLKPIDCIVVEDSFSGIQSAYRAGIGHIVGFGPDEKHSNLRTFKGVSGTISSFEQFPFELLES